MAGGGGGGAGLYTARGAGLGITGLTGAMGAWATAGWGAGPAQSIFCYFKDKPGDMDVYHLE